MKTLSLSINVAKVSLAEEDKKKSPEELSCLVVKNMILNFASQTRGLSDDDRRRYYKICDVLEGAVKHGAADVDLEDDWFGFIKKCKREGLIMPNDLIRLVEEKIEEVPDR